MALITGVILFQMNPKLLRNCSDDNHKIIVLVFIFKTSL